MSRKCVRSAGFNPSTFRRLSWRSQSVPKILNHILDSFFEIDTRFPTENFFCARDVGLTHFWIVHRQRLVHSFLILCR